MKSIAERIDQIKVDRFAIRYADLLKRIEQLEIDIVDLTYSFQIEFDHINEIMGCFLDGLNTILQSQSQSSKTSTAH
jgi:hypothetical protein